MEQNINDHTLRSYAKLRTLIGILGVSLPFVVIVGTNVLGACDDVQLSISHYYYTITHIVFVGTLCVLGAFLITYKGNSKYRYENLVSNLAGCFSFCIAIFPTALTDFRQGNGSCQYISVLENTALPKYVNALHFGSAGLLFVCFAIFCFKIFQDSDLGVINHKKIRRNKIYTICGSIIIASMLAIVGITIYNRATNSDIFPAYILIFEITSLIPFGISWLIKGSVFWKHSDNGLIRMIAEPIR